MRIPFPPPPAEALIKIGKPIFLASFSASSIVSIVPKEPGMTGQSTLRASAFACALSPRRAIVFAVGPIKVSPQLSQIEAKF